MKNKNLKHLVKICFCFLIMSSLYAQEECGTVPGLNIEKKNNPKRQSYLDDLEKKTHNWIKTNNTQTRSNVITIPVVVHVVHNTNEENIPVSQVNAQIEQLNKDFRRLNNDTDNTWSQAADTEIEFCLANYDPSCASTSGITYFNTDTDLFIADENKVKSSSTGGVDPWPTDKYLNIWVCNLDLNGFAQFPGGDPLTDGVVVDYDVFGVVDPINNNVKRTTTHEVGHYLNLIHIWGEPADETLGCSVDDMVADTPNSDLPTNYCDPIAMNPSSCGSTDMVENYMDYSGGCRNLFTLGQKNRMHATLALARSSLLESIVCEPAPTCDVTENVQIVDLQDFSVTISWDPGAQGLSRYRYRKLGMSSWTEMTTSESTITILNLAPLTKYEFEVNSYCNSCWAAIDFETQCSDTFPCDLCFPITDLVINSSQVLSQNQISGDLIINDGVTLTINQKVEFKETSKVQVKPGGKLIVEGNGLLTKCPNADYWQGVKLKDNNGSIFENNPGGKAIIRNGGTIEYAKIGVFKSLGQGATIAGPSKLQMTTGAVIRNCDIGVVFSNDGNSMGFLGEQETSIIDDAFFIENETAIKLRFSNGLTLNRNTFTDNYFGVEVTNSKVDIYDNNFANEGESIIINALYPNVTGLNIERNKFTYGGAAVYTQSLNNADYLVIKQNILMGSYINTHGVSNFEIIANNISNCNDKAIEHSATGDNIRNVVRSNAFSDNNSGIYVDGINNVEFLTNCFENTTNADIRLGYNTTIREEQGTPQNEAGNCFDGGPRLTTTDTNENLSFTYYKFPQPSGNPNWDCKEPKGSISTNYVVKDADNEITALCGAYVYGSNLPEEHRDCIEFINNNQGDKEALLDLIASLEAEIDRLYNEVVNGNLENWVYVILKAKYEECIDSAKKKIIKIIVHEPHGDPRDRAINFLLTDDNFRFQIMAYGLMMNGNEYTRAGQYLNTLVGDREDQTDFIEVQNIYLEYVSDRDGFKLENTDRSTIYDAGMKRLPLAGFARTVYHELTGERIFLEMPQYDDNTGNGKSRLIKDEFEVNIFPNPSLSNDVIKIAIHGASNKETEYSVSVYNSQGVLVSEQIVSLGNSELLIPEVKGLLFITVKEEGQIIHTDKVIRL